MRPTPNTKYTPKQLSSMAIERIKSDPECYSPGLWHDTCTISDSHPSGYAADWAGHIDNILLEESRDKFDPSENGLHYDVWAVMGMTAVQWSEWILIDNELEDLERLHKSYFF
jgi:hypothetical protein